MLGINERFKDVPPEQTVENIQQILHDLGIELVENWVDSGIENCWSLRVCVKDAVSFGTNGKGVTKALARASAYGEFIERMQCGLFLYKFQSISRDPQMNLQSYAPDGKYMTMAELEADADWMDYIIETYGNGLTRKKLAEQCRIYACTDEDKIWTIPFYSLFENKHVFLPAGLVEHIYCANGCCAGNTREEAWIHALSEIMERRMTTKYLLDKKPAPKIPEEVIHKYPMTAGIMDTIRAKKQYDVEILDFSDGQALPVVAARLIDTKNHNYKVSVAADPILEIAIDRTLTEIFQGRTLDGLSSRHNGSVLEEANNIPVAHNVLNQLETSDGLFSIDFFTKEIPCSCCTHFENHQNKTNQELCKFILELYKKQGRPVYVRNYSFLGFNSYHFVVPGFSETRGLRLTEPICEYALGDSVQKVFRNIDTASETDLMMMLAFHKKISTAFSRVNNFRGLAGLPLDYTHNTMLAAITLSCAAYRLGRYEQAKNYLKPLTNSAQLNEEDRNYFSCIYRYLSLKCTNATNQQIKLLLDKFYTAETVDKLYACFEQSKTPYDAYLLRCDCAHCDTCRYQKNCSYTRCREILKVVGLRYNSFTTGQREENFKI